MANIATSVASKRAETEALNEKGYFIGRIIGQGTFATVYKAEYVDPGERGRMRLACKVFDNSMATLDFQNKFFPRELEILKRLDNPHIIQIHAIVRRGSKVYIFMRYAENGDLLDFIKRMGVVPEQQSKMWFRQITSGLQYLHGKNIAHRDLKCENILLSKRFNAKLADFGFARFCTDSSGRRILSKTYCGSAAYAAPEIVSGTPYNPKLADIWSLGIILFIMLNGAMPFNDASLRKLLRSQMRNDWSFHKRAESKTSNEAKTLIQQILEPDLTKRLRLESILGHDWLKAKHDVHPIAGRLVKSAPANQVSQLSGEESESIASGSSKTSKS